MTVDTVIESYAFYGWGGGLPAFFYFPNNSNILISDFDEIIIWNV